MTYDDINSEEEFDWYFKDLFIIFKWYLLTGLCESLIFLLLFPEWPYAHFIMIISLWPFQVMIALLSMFYDIYEVSIWIIALMPIITIYILRIFNNISNIEVEEKSTPVTLKWSNYWLTISLMLFLGVIYILGDIMYPGNYFVEIPTEIMDLFGQNNARIWNQGEIYRLFTAMFIHASIYHLSGNLLFLTIFGYKLEKMKGWTTVFLVFLLAGLLSNIFILFIQGPVDFWSIGASGGVLGLLAADLVILRQNFVRDSLLALSFLGFFIFLAINADNNHLGHLGGVIGGILIAFVFEKYYKNDPLLNSNLNKI
ncbi:MAG: rhomboid family intramembrane serine protease [Candidatus Hodarchaeales archaeon]|jgi:rhomboid protease GluP